MKIHQIISTPVALCMTATLLILGAGCREQTIPTYSGDRYVHFEPQKDQSPQVVMFNFATDAPLATAGKVSLRLNLWGDLLEENATYTLRANGSALQDGVFAAGAATTTYELPVQRDPDLLGTDYTIEVELTSVQSATVAPQKYKTATVHVIDHVQEPTWWKQSKAKRLGAYSDLKYRVFIIFMDGKILESLDDYTGLTFMILAKKFKSWWKKEWQAGRYHYYAADGVTPLYDTIK